jgi:hypothetical protein
VRSADDLKVPLPENSLTINAVAKQLAADLPRGAIWPKGNATEWQKDRRAALADVVRIPNYKATAEPVRETVRKGETSAAYRVVKAGPWSVPVVELTRGESSGTVIVTADGGRAAAASQIEAQLAAGKRVLAVDLYAYGECRAPSHEWLWSLMLATVGDRALGVQAAQLDAVVRSAGAKGVAVIAVGPRTSTAALVAAALDERIAALELHDPLGSFKEIVETNRAVSATPELFCFGLLEKFDVVDLAALVAPRPVVVKKPSGRAGKEFGRLPAWYTALGTEFDPLK